MSDIQNLDHTASIEKIRELAEDVNICLFTTNLTQLPLSTRPMSTQKVENDGSIWFLSEKDSEKNRDIQSDNRVQLFYANRGSSEFLSVYGTASILQDREKAKELWTPLAKTWFQEGPDDPKLTLIKVVPQDGYYWDTKDGKIVTMMKIAAGAVTGREMDGGVQGKMSL